MRAKFGFIFNGYRENAFFWEIVIMYRKIFVIFVQVLLASLGKMIQV
jgi:hypothetical protein